MEEPDVQFLIKFNVDLENKEISFGALEPLVQAFEQAHSIVNSKLLNLIRGQKNTMIFLENVWSLVLGKDK